MRNACDLALITGLRREDVTLLRLSNVKEDRLFIIQEKTGYKLAIPLDLKLGAAGLMLHDVIERCREGNPSDFMVYSPVRRGGRKPGPLTPDILTQAFAEIRDSTELKFGPSPPLFMRSKVWRADSMKMNAERILHSDCLYTKI